MKHIKIYEEFINKSEVFEKREDVGKYNTVKKVLAKLGRRPSEQELATFINNNYYDVTEFEKGEDDETAYNKIADLVAFYKFDIDDWEIAWADAQNEAVVTEGNQLKKGDIVKFKDGSSIYIVGPKGDGYDYKDGREKGHHPKGWFDMMISSGKAIVESVVTEAKNTIGLAFKDENDYNGFVEFIEDEGGKIFKNIGWDNKTRSWTVTMDTSVLDDIYGEGHPGNKESGWYGALPTDFESVIIEGFVSEAFIGPFVFNDTMSDEELKAMYDGALDGYANWQKGFQHPKAKYKQAYQEIEKLLKKRGVEESIVTESEAVNILNDLLDERGGDMGELHGMSIEDAQDTVEAYGHKGSKAKKIAQELHSLCNESVVTEAKTSAVYADPNTGKKYDLQYVSTKKRWELDIMKKGASIYSSAITTIKRDTLAEIQEWLDGYNIDSSWTKGLSESVVTENFPGPGETVDAKYLDYDMLDYFNRTNKVLSIDTKTKKGIKGSVGKMHNDLVFNGDDIQLKDIIRIKILESVITEGREANQFGIESQHIGKLQNGKMSKYTEGTGMPFGLISRPESGLSDTDKNAVKDYVNADNIVLGFYPMEDSNNDTMYNAVKAGGIKIIEDLVSKEYGLKLIETIKGKRHCAGDTCSLMHYLVFSKTNESVYTHILNMDQFLNESKSDFQVYHNQYSSTIDEVEKYANKMGYDLDAEEYGNAYIDGFFKPNDGQTKKDTISLYKNGKEQKKALHVQIYGMGNKFEINMYIN